MYSDLTWNLAAELFVSCSTQDIDIDFEHTESHVHQIVDRTGLSTAQRRRLRTDIIKAALHGFSQIAKSWECSQIIIQVYIKENGFNLGSQESPEAQDLQMAGSENQPLHAGTSVKVARNSGWGYFLIERIADRQEDAPAAASYIIEVFLYREG